MVRDLAGGVAEADFCVERGGADPKGATLIVELFRSPEPHVMPTARIVADRLFERQILLAAPKIKIADGRVVVGTMQNGIVGDTQRAFERDWVGRIPAGGEHCLGQLLFTADQGDVQGVAVNAVFRVRDRGNIVERGMMLRGVTPSGRDQDVGDRGIGNRDEEGDPNSSPDQASTMNGERVFGRRRLISDRLSSLWREGDASMPLAGGGKSRLGEAIFSGLALRRLAILATLPVDLSYRHRWGETRGKIMRQGDRARRGNCIKFFEFILFALASWSLCSTDQSFGAVTLTKNSSTSWTINNGPLTVNFNPNSGFGKLTSISFNGSTNLISSLDQELAGTPFVANTAQTLNSAIGPNNSWVDVWTDVPSGGTNNNPIDFQFHYVLFNNDPAVHVYEVLNHSATDPATSVGQGQFLFRTANSSSLFPSFYQKNTGPNNLTGVTTPNLPSTNANFGTVSGQTGRTVQDATTDLTGSGIAGDNGTNFYTKYDYSTYTQFWQGTTQYGSQYSVTALVPSTESMTGGPTKQVLNQTNPGIVNLEFLSDHYGIDADGAAFPGYAYTPPQGVNSTKVFGPFAFRIESSSGKTGAQIYQDGINSLPSYQTLYNSETELQASGYLTTSQRSSMQITAANSSGWSSNSANNTVVLSQPGVNMQESTQGYQYWAQLAQNGTATISNAAPGTYRMTLYQLGQWGETRVDGVQIKNGFVSVPQNVQFTPENFGTAAPIWTIGTPDRSAHEFLNGHNAAGLDQRQFQGSYDFWGEEQTLGNPGKVVYYAMPVGATPATNDPNKWIANQWRTFNPGLYDAANSTTDNYSNIAPAYVRDAAHGGTGPGPANYHGSPWEVHFTVTQQQLNQGQFVVLSVGAAALNSNLTVSLNGHSETWNSNNFPGPDDPDTRSGDAGFYQWAAFQFPIADLNAAGIEDVMTFSMGTNSGEGLMYDALRMEITNTSADPSTTGWTDYNYINGNTHVGQNDAAALAAQNSFVAVPEPGGILLTGIAVVAFLGCGRIGKRK